MESNNQPEAIDPKGIVAKLGLIVVAEKHLPELFEGAYERTHDELREAVELAIRTGRAEYQGLEIKVEEQI